MALLVLLAVLAAQSEVLHFFQLPVVKLLAASAQAISRLQGVFGWIICLAILCKYETLHAVICEGKLFLVSL